MRSYQTRSKTEKQKMEETARILVQMSQGSPRASLNASPNASPRASPHASPKACPTTPIKLSNSILKAPSAPLPHLSRSLSHFDVAYQRAMKVAPYTKPGDTILMNFYVDRDAYATVMFMKNEDGVMRIHTIEEPYDTINMSWTYEVTDFGF